MRGGVDGNERRPPRSPRAESRWWPLLLLFLAACRGEGASGPVEVKFDRDTCRGCGMVISDRQFAAQVRAPTGAVAKFDDVGCAAKWLAGQPFAADPAVQVWVATLDDGQWAEARAVGFVSGKRSPMGYGYGATRDGGVPFAVVQQQLARGGTP